MAIDTTASWFANLPNKADGVLPISEQSFVTSDHILQRVGKELSSLGARIVSDYSGEALKFKPAWRWDRLSSFNAPATGEGAVFIVVLEGRRFLGYKLDFSGSVLMQVAVCVGLPILLGFASDFLLSGFVVAILAVIIWPTIMWFCTQHKADKFFSDALAKAVGQD